ncbi:NAD(P)H-hydrate dehydratase [Paucibacter sp. PLA-PC-4]|uniref:NAD(P)H-hydrate dehydratase n=1 Tax=Paucibacter sp. PLA-PC-4 TaxID=2993655 RepID=UPI002248F179|nr:NAD(P)H-hydrate dehydratase [Paucibacter sp. PLA-PC-4]MCX2862668.1 NAD(P)H-hydrate dehydratase [Paucibacter sp. PLA-PC-4]
MRPALRSIDHLPLYRTVSSRTIEAQALQTTRPHELMQRAGAAVAKLALALQPHARHIWLLCGPGNNGGDGLVAARLLQAAGKQVRISLCGGAGRTAAADAAWALQQAQAAGLAIETVLPTSAPKADLLIDALLGLGLSRAPDSTVAEAIRLLNHHPAPTLAVDLPSGMDGDSGRALLSVQAQHTLALLTLKPGMFTAEGRSLCGEIWWDDLGQAPAGSADAQLLGRQALRDWRRLSGPRGHASHKGSWGDVLVVGGAAGMRGAAWLAARAALAAGAGRVYACLLQAEAGVAAPQDRPELMNWSESLLQFPDSWQRHIVVAGCGGGAAIAAPLPDLLRHARRLVLDADALNAIAADSHLRQLLRARQTLGRPTLLTPHPLEAARLMHIDTAEVQAGRLGAAQALSQEFGCTVLLKGSGTVIASPQQAPAINGSGNAALATAGTGDVLAGWLGGLWAQYGGEDPAATHALACAAAYWHGLAGDTQKSGPLRAADLIESMHALHARD